MLGALVCYAFIAQTITHKRQQKERLLAGLKSRARNFKFMLNGFPEQFLPKDLTLLIQRSLMQICEQMSQLEPNEPAHADDVQKIAQQMAETQRQSPHKQPSANLQNPQQIREVKACLEELYKYIFHLEAKRNLTRAQADTYRSIVKQLVLQLTVDSYVLHGRIAKEKDKIRLAAHYFDLGLKLMVREGKNGQFDGRISQLQTIISELQTRIAASETGPIPSEQEDKAAIDSEWEKFGTDDASWKKKQVYD